MKLIFLGVTGFPLSEAAAQKSIYICKSLVEVGVDITMVCKKSVLSEDVTFDSKGTYEGVPYVCTAGTPYRSKSWYIRNFNKVKGFINEFWYTYVSQKESEIDAAIIYTRSFLNVILYKFYSKLFNFKIVVNYGELRSKINYSNISFGFKKNDYLFDKYIYLLADGFLPISNYLIDTIREKPRIVPYLKIPPLCDYSLFENNIPKFASDTKYFLYCGSLGYYEIVEFILNAYHLLQNNKFSLYLIVHGSTERMARLNEFLQSTYTDSKQVRIFSDLTYKDLVSYYSSAYALLIPLRPNIQDIARFPHKIGEYCATGRPIITTAIGEVVNYFKDGESAYIASEYDVNLYAEKMKEAISDSGKAEGIGLTGKKIGLKNFNYKSYGKKIIQFIDSIEK